MQVAVIGAAGAVGRQIIELLKKRSFPINALHCFATSRKKIEEGLFTEILNEKSLPSVDLAFFCAGSSVSKEWIPKFVDEGALVIDLSSAFRMDPEVPLVIPEINPEAMSQQRGIIASPNCAATILLMPLAPLHRRFGVKRVICSTYQAASGGGYKLMETLQNETLAALANKPVSHPLGFPYAFNCYPHNSELHESGYVDEEIKMREETQKILKDPNIGLSATCIRVPTLRAHAISANIAFHLPFELEEIYQALHNSPGIKLFENRTENRFATPFDAAGKDEVFCGRFRMDSTQPNTLEFWAVGDQLLKGAALNAVQIAEKLKIYAPT